ncbi:non-canonical purine NTP pyrophosphatase [Helicobacter himalayensis]|uniref:non-canonical purine NTP pyrophosphatase n=1 Tax=Helicobacter himalayensis TaxID=1591088 RepID=UPI00082A7CEE|nr:non-canonical purine NTP pyrophosphatase [Helicobacter himalayensis]
MLLILATSNLHKVKEIREIFAESLNGVQVLQNTSCERVKNPKNKGRVEQNYHLNNPIVKNPLQSLKIRSFKDFLTPFEIVENGSSFAENARIKAEAIYKALRESLEQESLQNKTFLHKVSAEELQDLQNRDFFILSEDSGLCIDVFEGSPGIYSARFLEQETLRFDAWNAYKKGLSKDFDIDRLNVKRVLFELKMCNLKESNARFVANLCLLDSQKNTKHFEGICEGRVIGEILGNSGFGYDPIFVPNGYTQTLAQIEEKNAISHRKKALDKCIGYLQAILAQPQ